jgi:AraC family transcriptional regulator, regulatory protein of adaptative response / DNA-3-methyladenine glycosylase II
MVSGFTLIPSTGSTTRVDTMVEAVLRARGLYSLRLTARTDAWHARMPEGRWAEACQLSDGRVVVRASCNRAVDESRFLLALDDDTSEFHRRFAADPLLGPSVRALRGLRPTRTATVAHATLRAICGQLVQSRRARELERTVIRTCGEDPPTLEVLRRLSPARLTACGLATSRAAALTRLVRTVDLESLRAEPSDRVVGRLTRERGVGPWTVGVIALQGLGRYDVGLVSDLGLVKLFASVRGRWPEQPTETAELLAPYGEWRGLASVFLLAGFSRGLVPGANADRARLVRRTHGAAA